MRALSALAFAAALAGPALADSCPTNGEGLGYGSLTCTCEAVNTSIGLLYGTDRYTGDSNLCLAAVHAGQISTDGGEITAYGRNGCKSFEGSYRNGVSSGSWGLYGNSFVFDMYLPSCQAF